jgi:hypothetical protein
MFATSRGELWVSPQPQDWSPAFCSPGANPDLTAVLSIELRLLVVK